jgi:hypothetical protein
MNAFGSRAARFLFLLACSLFSSWAWAEPGVPLPLTPTVEAAPAAHLFGRVRELGSSDPLRSALVELLGTTRCAETDARGNYRLDSAPGSLQLRFSAVGHAPVLKTITLAPGQELKLNVSLDRVDFTSGTIVVRGKKERPQVITTTLSQTEIKKNPGSAGDALRAVQNLPGIAIPNDLSSQLVVQGGGPNDNLFLLDNIPWPVPFHFGGILSTVNSDLLSTVDLNAAGFGVRWGNCLGAVLDAKTRAGKKDRLHASLDTNLVTTQGLVETPLGWGDASLTLAGRRSYFDLFMGPLMKRFSSSSGSGFTAFPYFWDLGGSLDVSLTPHDHIRALALGSDDILGLYIAPEDSRDPAFSGDFRMENRAFTSGFSWINTAVTGLVSTLTPYYYQTLSANSLGTGFEINLQQDVAGVKEEAEWNAGEWLGMKHELGAGGGIEWQTYSQSMYFYKSVTNGIPTDPTGTTITARCINRNAYLQDRVLLLPALALTAGLHYDKNDRVAGDVLTPRLSLEWQADPLTLWKAGWGLYDQFPGALLTNPDFGNPQLSANRAEHTVLSLERKFSRDLLGRVDAYYKKYYDLVVNDSDTTINKGLGTAKGVEFFLRENLGEKFFGWISYAYSKSERMRPPVNDWTVYQYDQPNILTLVAHYNFTPAWGLGSKVHYNSGPLVKSLKTRYQDLGGTWRATYSDTYDQRLDDYLRVDMRMDYVWRFEGWRLSAYLEILNVLDRGNPAGITYSEDYSKAEVINNLPRMPYFGIEAEF